jgi:uncharacterized protein (TIGR02117 family)
MLSQTVIDSAVTGAGVTIYVITNPIHTDIIIPVEAEARATFAFLADDGMPLDNPNVKWLMFGRGGRSFYIETPTWDKLKPMPALRGLTLDRAAMHVEPLGAINPELAQLIPLTISHDALKRLRNEILVSFSLDTAGKPQPIANSAYGEFDQFYEATGYFNALLGCNTWTARMLRTAGLRTGLWNPFPQSLRFSLNLYN